MTHSERINQRILAFLEGADATPAGIEAGKYQEARDYALDRYIEKGFRHYVECLRWLGFGGRRSGLDLGSGAGHWCLAFAHLGGEATGIEMRPEFVCIAESCARAVGYGERVRFVPERIESAKIPAAAFDAAWSHAVLMYTDAEPAIEKAASSLVEGGDFYLAYIAEGLRLARIDAGLRGEEPHRVGPQLAMMLNGYLHRAGIYSTLGGRVRMLRFQDLRRICEAFGLSYRDQPTLQDDPGHFRGIPASFDLLTRKTRGGGALFGELLCGRAAEDNWWAALENLLQADCPRLVAKVIATIDPKLAVCDHVDLYARALIRAGCAREAAAIVEGGRALPDLTKGLYWHDRGRFAEALACYARLGGDHPDKGFLSGCCHLSLGDLEAAVAEFRSAIAGGRAELRQWVGWLASEQRAGEDRARAAYDAFLRSGFEWNG